MDNSLEWGKKMKNKPRKPTSVKKRTRKGTVPGAPPAHPGRPSQLRTFPFSGGKWPSLNIAKVLSGFLTFRSTLKSLSASLQRMESIMDNVYQMMESFGHALPFLPHRGGPGPFPLLPPGTGPGGGMRQGGNSSERTQSPGGQGEDFPIIRLPHENRFQPPQGQQQTPPPPMPNLPPLDLSQLMSIMQSPLVQQFLAGLFQNRRNQG
jgi:hypothetical protein